MNDPKAPPPKTESPRIVTVTEINDPAAAREDQGLLDQDLVRLDSKRWSAKRVTVRLDDCAVIYQKTNRRVRSRTTLPDGMMSFFALGPRSHGSIDGMSMSPQESTYLAWLDVAELGLNDPPGFFEQKGLGMSPGEQFGDNRNVFVQ